MHDDLIMDLDAAIKDKNIDPDENGTSVQVGGDLYIELASARRSRFVCGGSTGIPRTVCGGGTRMLCSAW